MNRVAFVAVLTAALATIGPYLSTSKSLTRGSVAMADPGRASSADSAGHEGTLTVPWTDFRELIDLENDRVVLTLEIFHKLLAQTTAAPPAYTSTGGNVVLTREEFQRLVDQMRPPGGPGVPPPFSHLITRAVYSGRLLGNDTAFTATFDVHVLTDGAYLEIPILPQSVALRQVKVDGQPALIVRGNGTHQIVLATPGPHTIEAAFALRARDSSGPRRIDLSILETPITLLELELPMSGIDVDVPQAQQLALAPNEDETGTVVNAVIAPGNAISIQWRTEVAVADKVPAKIYSEVHQVVSVDDNVLQLHAEVRLDILHSEIERIALTLPRGMNVLSVSGDGVGEWSEDLDSNVVSIDVPFTYARKGPAILMVSAEQPLQEKSLTTSFAGLRVTGAVRETGFLGVEVRTSGEVSVVEHRGLEQIGVPRLPQALQTRSVKPLMHGFRFTSHPYALVLSVLQHEKIEVPVAAISAANAVTLFTRDGKMVYRVVYQVRNSAKQFLTLDMPEGADIWTVFVDQQPVESAINGDGALLVPLVRSRVVDQQLADFPVEVVYCMVGDRFAPAATRQAQLPSVDLLTSQLIWSVYLPEDYTYHHFRSTLEKEEIIRSLNLFAGAKRRYDGEAMKSLREHRPGKENDGPPLGSSDELDRLYDGSDHDSRFRNLPLDRREMSSQVQAELEFGGRMEGLAQEPAARLRIPPSPARTGGVGGVLPIQIHVPTGGQVYRFARTIIRPEDELRMSVGYSAGWVMRSVEWIAGLLLFGWGWWQRRRLSRLIHRAVSTFSAAVNRSARHVPSGWSILRRMSSSIMSTVILLGLLGPAWFVCAPLAGLVLFLLWISVVYQVLLFGRRRSRDRVVARERA